MPFLAMAYRLISDVKYLRSAEAWALASCDYEHRAPADRRVAIWPSGIRPCGLALVYDWLYDALAPEARDTIRRGDLPCRGVPRNHKALLQNHLWVSITSLGPAALALAGQHSCRGPSWR